MSLYTPERLVSISRYQNYFPTLSPDIQHDIYSRIGDAVVNELQLLFEEERTVLLLGCGFGFGGKDILLAAVHPLHHTGADALKAADNIAILLAEFNHQIILLSACNSGLFPTAKVTDHAVQGASLWLCRTYMKKGRSVCASRGIRERVLLDIVGEAGNLDNITVYPDGRLVYTSNKDYGNGTITKMTGAKIYIDFAGRLRVFSYPEAFEKEYLILI